MPIFRSYTTFNSNIHRLYCRRQGQTGSAVTGSLTHVGNVNRIGSNGQLSLRHACDRSYHYIVVVSVSEKLRCTVYDDHGHDDTIYHPFPSTYFHYHRWPDGQRKGSLRCTVPKIIYWALQFLQVFDVFKRVWFRQAFKSLWSDSRRYFHCNPRSPKVDIIPDVSAQVSNVSRHQQAARVPAKIWNERVTGKQRKTKRSKYTDKTSEPADLAKWTTYNRKP